MLRTYLGPLSADHDGFVIAEGASMSSSKTIMPRTVEILAEIHRLRINL